MSQHMIRVYLDWIDKCSNYDANGTLVCQWLFEFRRRDYKLRIPKFSEKLFKYDKLWTLRNLDVSNIYMMWIMFASKDGAINMHLLIIKAYFCRFGIVHPNISYTILLHKKQISTKKVEIALLYQFYQKCWIWKLLRNSKCKV